MEQRPDNLLDRLELLAMLELSDQERETARADLKQMLDYIDKLKELDTTGVEPMVHSFPSANIFREDVVTNTDGQEDTLANAPSQRKHSLSVPRIFS